MDGQEDGQTDETDFIGRYPTSSAKRPTEVADFFSFACYVEFTYRRQYTIF